jgi:hypothetical protein
MRLMSLHRSRGRRRGMLLELGVVAGLVLAACGDSTSSSESNEAVSATSEVAQTSLATVGSEPAEPLVTIVWDGTAASYVGPETMEAGFFEVRTVNDSDHVVDFVWGRIDPEWDVTEEDVIAWDETETDVPPWLIVYGHFAKDVPAGETRSSEQAYLLDGYRYQLAIWDVTADEGHFFAFVDVVSQGESSEAESASSEDVQTLPATADSEPLMTIVWDGTATSYVGPQTIEGDRQFDVRLVNDSESDVVDFSFVRVDPEMNVTEEEAIAWVETETSKPPWSVGDPGDFAAYVQAGDTVDGQGYVFGGYRYELVVWNVTAGHGRFVAFVDVVSN